jgi:hypothetical protein
VNHCCHCNVQSTGYGFEIAIRDIQAGEELTDDYGAFNVESDMDLICHYADCRKKVRASDLDEYGAEWDRTVRRALEDLHKVPQPLNMFLDENTVRELERYLETGEGYVSVKSLRYRS